MRACAYESHLLSYCARAPDGRYLASASADNTVRIWDPAKLKHTKTLRGHNSYVLDVSFSPDGRYLVSASVDKTIKVWDMTRAIVTVSTLMIHTKSVYGVAFSPDGRYLATASADARAPKN